MTTNVGGLGAGHTLWASSETGRQGGSRCRPAWKPRTRPQEDKKLDKELASKFISLQSPIQHLGPFPSSKENRDIPHFRSCIESPSRQVAKSTRRRRQTPLRKVGREQRTDHHRKSPGHRAHLPTPPATSPHPKNHQQSSFLPPPPDLSNDRAQYARYPASSYSTLPSRRNGSSAVGRPAVDAASDEIGPDFAVYVFPSQRKPRSPRPNHETQLLTLPLHSRVVRWVCYHSIDTIVTPHFCR